MKKIKETVIFIIFFLLILFVNFLFYKNIDIFLPTHEKEVYAYENNIKKAKKDFLIELYEQIEKQSEYKLIEDEEIETITGNEVIYNIIKNNIIENTVDEEIKEIMAENLYTEELSNTIYGELKIIDSLYQYTFNRNFAIVYSKDMTKLCYLDKDEILNSILYKGRINEIKETQIWNYDEEIFLDDKKSKTELIDSCKMAISNLIKDSEFTPDTIMYIDNYYILKDISRDITIYYNANDNILLGFYIGFEK